MQSSIFLFSLYFGKEIRIKHHVSILKPMDCFLNHSIKYYRSLRMHEKKLEMAGIRSECFSDDAGSV
jgi:hypothetical protein